MIFFTNNGNDDKRIKVQWYIFAHARKKDISEKFMRRDGAWRPKINYGLQYHRV